MARRFDRIGWAMAQEGLTCPQKSVLIILADAADEVRGVCWLKHATIAERTSLGITATKAAIRALESMELVRVADRNDKRGRQTSNYYQLGYYDPEEEIDWRGSPDDTLRTDEGVARRPHGGSGDDPSIVNQPERLNQTTQRKKTSSPSSSRSRSARPAPDDGPDKSKVDTVNAWLRPETKPQPVEKPRRAPSKKTATKPPEEHIHAPQRRSASGLACYWAILLENTGSLEPNEEARVGKFFKVWLERGLEVDLARQMIDLFFADLELANSTRRWTRFVAHAESLRQRVLARDAKGGRRSKADSKPFSWIDSLPPALREVALSGEDVA